MNFWRLFIFGGGGRRRRTNNRGSDLRYDINISLEDAFHGKKFKVKIPTQISCASCAGSGSAKGSQPVTCQTCGGRGQVRSQRDSSLFSRHALLVKELVQ